jgi:predicted short-subunit dehydrogenase-like oxidoreductase (DUF2520 family)
MVHTSGSTSLDVLLNYTDKAGVLYPLQTFSKIREVDFDCSAYVLKQQMTHYMLILSNLRLLLVTIYSVNSQGRKILHLAAVFACNFPNYLYGIANSCLQAIKWILIYYAP